MKTFAIATVCLVGFFASNNARAQSLGLGDIVQQNLAFDAYARQQAGEIAQQFLTDRWNYRVQNNDWGYIPGPVSPMDVSRSIGELNRTYENNNAAWHENSQRIDAALDRWHTAFRGDWYYADPDTGNMQVLPYTVDSYTSGPWGYTYEGYTPGGTNYLPVED
jgi:hypothetical protein